MMKTLLALLLLIIVMLSFTIKGPFAIPVPEGWPKPLYRSKDNTITEERIEIGRILFYDNRLSQNNMISCASCHSSYNAFAHTDHALSHGIHDAIGNRNAPALFNLAWQPSFMWDGAIHHLDAQALAPITHPKEMNETLEHIVIKLRQDKNYRIKFMNAYGDSLITGERILKCIAQFTLTLISSDAKYDQVKKGIQQFTPQEQRGYRLYKTHCASCHTEPLFSSYTFKNNGLQPDPLLDDLGHFRITQNSADSFLFKVPSLRNLEYTYPYMHDGRFKRIRDVLDHYSGLNPDLPHLSKELKPPLNLSPDQKVELISFLLTLSDKKFVFNTDYTYPKEFPYSYMNK